MGPGYHFAPLQLSDMSTSMKSALTQDDYTVQAGPPDFFFLLDLLVNWFALSTLIFGRILMFSQIQFRIPVPTGFFAQCPNRVLSYVSNIFQFFSVHISPTYHFICNCMETGARIHIIIHVYSLEFEITTAIPSSVISQRSNGNIYDM